MKYLKMFEELELTYKTLDSPNINGGGLRGDILIDKLEKGEKLTTKSNKKVTIKQVKDLDGEFVEPADALDDLKTNGHYDPNKAKKFFGRNKSVNDKGYKQVFKDTDDSLFKLTDLVKTADFGSTGPGKETEKYEILQCVFLSIKILYPDLDLTYFENGINKLNVMEFLKDNEELSGADILKKLNLHISNKPVPTSIINNLLDVIGDVEFTDPNWITTFVKLPNAIYNTDLFKKIEYSVYHIGCTDINSPFMRISRKYHDIKKTCAIDGTIPNINMAKYCPADVYVVSKDEVNIINNAVNQVRNFGELTSLLDNLFNNGKLIPISLKKISKNTDFRILTNRAVNKKMPDFKILNFSITEDPLFGIGSKIKVLSTWSNETDSTAEHVTRTLTIDTSHSSSLRDVDGEIDGTTSRHGKVALQAMIRMIYNTANTLGRQPMNIDRYMVLALLTRDELIRKINDAYGDLRNMCNGIGRIDLIESKRYAKSSPLNTNNKLISKLQSLQVLIAIADLYNGEVDNQTNDAIFRNIYETNILITNIISYALSIKTDLFDKTPKYLRVI